MAYVADDDEAGLVVFNWLMHKGGERALEWVNAGGESFMSLFEATLHIPRVLYNAIRQSVEKTASQYPTRWLCLTQAARLLTTISQKIQGVILKKGLLACIPSERSSVKTTKDWLAIRAAYRSIELLRIVIALHLRFPMFFKMTFDEKVWRSLMNVCKNYPICLLMHRLCYPFDDEKGSVNAHHRFIALPSCIIQHIYSYLPTLFAVKRLDVLTLYNQVTNQWDALTDTRLC